MHQIWPACQQEACCPSRVPGSGGERTERSPAALCLLFWKVFTDIEGGRTANFCLLVSETFIKAYCSPAYLVITRMWLWYNKQICLVVIQGTDAQVAWILRWEGIKDLLFHQSFPLLSSPASSGGAATFHSISRGWAAVFSRQLLKWLPECLAPKRACLFLFKKSVSCLANKNCGNK